MNPRNETQGTDWIDYLFKDIPHDVVDNIDRKTYIDNSILIDVPSINPYYSHIYVEAMYERQMNFGYIHLDDIRCDDIRWRDDMLHHLQCRFVIKPYWRPDHYKNVHQIPVGWSLGYTTYSTDVDIDSRKYKWAWVGSRWDRNRKEMKRQFGRLSTGKFHRATTPEKIITADKISKIYRNSQFVPCPMGLYGNETSRICEALEAGAIPVVLKHRYWRSAYTNVPYLQADTWKDAVDKIESLSEYKTEQLRLECWHWWQKQKVTAQDTVKLSVETLLDN